MDDFPRESLLLDERCLRHLDEVVDGEEEHLEQGKKSGQVSSRRREQPLYGQRDGYLPTAEPCGRSSPRRERWAPLDAREEGAHAGDV